MVPEYLIKKSADIAFNMLEHVVRQGRAKSNSSADSLQAAIERHLRGIKNWSAEVSFLDLKGTKATSDVFVPLDLFLQPRRLRLSPEERVEIRPLEEVLATSSGHIVILGNPGAGKTTSMKHLCQRLLTEESFLPDLNFPVVVRLTELVRYISRSPDDEETDPLAASLQEILGIDLSHDPLPSIPSDLKGAEQLESHKAGRRKAIAARRSLNRSVVASVVDSLQVLLILDGFDEIPSATVRDSLIQEIRELANQVERSRILLTSRTGEFNYHIGNCSQFEIHPLTDRQILAFASRWLGPTDGAVLIKKLRASPYGDSTIRPITLAHICAIYERLGRIPDKPKTVYRMIIMLLLERWDEQWGVRRTTTYAGFEPDRKLEFLAHLAYTLTLSVHSTLFTKADLARAYEEICGNFSLPVGEASKVARVLESHTGIFLQCGQDSFEFAHKSFQEFLTAQHIVLLPAIPFVWSGLLEIPNELAIAVSISSKPGDYFAQLILDRLKHEAPGLSFIRPFVSRLLLERPDFEISDRVGAALLSLYSSYVSAALHEIYAALGPLEPLDREFEDLGRLVRNQILGLEMLGIYEIKETIEIPGGRQVIRIEKVKHERTTGLGSVSYFPRPDWQQVAWVFPWILERD